MPYSYLWEDIFSPGKAVDFFSSNNPKPFETKKLSFSRTNAWWLSELSRLIYVRDANEVDTEYVTVSRNSFLNKMGLEEKWFYNGRYVKCAIIGTLTKHKKRSFSVLVFRGTEGRISNWFFNFNTLLSPWLSGGKVHRGFKLLLMEAWEEINHQLESIKNPIYYTGHSLGGALAVLAASLKQPEAVYTFGSPMIGNAEFVYSTKHIKIYRVVNPNDIVAGVSPFPGMMHVGKPYYLNSSKSPHHERAWFEPPEFLADHSPLNYTFQL
ncbi:MAG: lipase family protein [Desulfamplus sp.]|nr:lipase family protein [Desulfamplus sp.]